MTAISQEDTMTLITNTEFDATEEQDAALLQLNHPDPREDSPTFATPEMDAAIADWEIMLEGLLEDEEVWVEADDDYNTNMNDPFNAGIRCEGRARQEFSGDDLRYECEYGEPLICICEPMCSGNRQLNE